MSQNLQNIAKFQKFQLENLVDFEKCCKTHILLQKSEPIQPKTSNILPKFCQPTLSDVAGPGRQGRPTSRRASTLPARRKTRKTCAPRFARRSAGTSCVLFKVRTAQLFHKRRRLRLKHFLQFALRKDTILNY